jgi:hypothetical protein
MASLEMAVRWFRALRSGPALYSIESYGHRGHSLSRLPYNPRRKRRGNGRNSMARSLSIIGFLALAIGLLWIGQGTGAIRWPPSSFMVNQLQWAGYGALLGAVGLILIWQGNR